MAIWRNLVEAASLSPTTTLTFNFGGQTSVPEGYRINDITPLTGPLLVDDHGCSRSVQSGRNAGVYGVNSIFDPCNVFCQIEGSANLGHFADFRGNVGFHPYHEPELEIRENVVIDGEPFFNSSKSQVCHGCWRQTNRTFTRLHYSRMRGLLLHLRPIIISKNNLFPALVTST